jgi:hypothetical protein
MLLWITVPVLHGPKRAISGLDRMSNCDIIAYENESSRMLSSREGQEYASKLAAYRNYG